MTYTYNLSPTFDNVARVRFHLSDTDQNATIYQDEEINAVITEVGTWQAAVIALIENLIAKLGQERQFQADWLNINPAGVLATYQTMLIQKRRLFGINDIVGASMHPYRPDSFNSAPPDYTSTQQGAYSDYANNPGYIGF